MSDIFISYARADQSRAKIIAEALERHELTVWWDPKIPPGKRYAQVIGDALESTKCILVLWSEESILSDWVKDEASVGKDREVLIPIMIDDVEVPFEFRRLQAAHLVDWQGELPNPEFAQLLEAISTILGRPLPEEALGPADQKASSAAAASRREGRPRGTWGVMDGPSALDWSFIKQYKWGKDVNVIWVVAIALVLCGLLLAYLIYTLLYVWY